MPAHASPHKPEIASGPGVIVPVFPSAALANQPVAGLPAAARVALWLAGRVDGAPLRIAVPGGWAPDRRCLAEAARLTGGRAIVAGNWHDLEQHAGLCPIDALALLARPEAGLAPLAPASTSSPERERIGKAQLEQAARRIIAATGKPGDGYVARYLNRPVSQAITAVLLRLAPDCRPMQVTVAVAVLALAMVVVLVTGGSAGLVAGALMFQAASILDGVDGEIARATHRASGLGASLDSITDAFTNLGFIAGLAINLHLSGQRDWALAGWVGLGALGLGLALLGTHAWLREGSVNFNAVKARLKAGRSSGGRWLARLVTRDCYALAFAIMVLAGLGGPALAVFAAGSCLWLVVVGWVLARW